MIEFVNLMEARSLVALEEKMDEYWYSDNWTMEPIYQGIRYQCLIDDTGELKFLGKKKDYKENSMYLLTELIEEIKSYNLPKNSLFEGYLTFGNDQQKAYQFLKSNEINEISKNLEFYFTDIIYLENKEFFLMPLFDRRSRLISLIQDKKLVKIQKSYTTNKKDKFEELKDSIKVFLFKDLESIYAFKQSMSWRIFKRPKSFFMIVTGFVENNKDEQYKGMVMALEGGQFKGGQIIKIMNVPVHSNDSRRYLYNSKKEILGQVFEFLALEKTKKGKFQETRFVNIRSDLKPEKCIYLEGN
jgi:ATP-dependent DNA ligase